MKLEKIEINGFKSFADKTEILLDGDITGIVGPNGSGKSNIADAVRWVLGEQSSRSLRGSKMEDVIFGGTQSRKQKAYCEVSLYFDNTDGRIRADYTEIVVTRKLYRSGESEYLLNRTPVRLKDILDIVRDTGIGREGYSIVGQGKIDEVLSAKPEARRKVFEEAAGVMKFRTRKEEAEHKLSKTQENLVRIGDILEELNNQVGPLADQAEKTRTYQGLFERQKLLDANLFLINHERVNTRKQKLQSDLAELERELRQDKTRLGDAAERSEALAERLTAIESSVAVLRAQYEEKSAAAEEQNSLRSVAAERGANLQREIQRLQQEQQAAEAEVAAQSDAAAQLQIRLEEMAQQNDGLTQEVAAVQQKRLAQLQEAAQQAQALEQTRQAQLQLLGQEAQLESELAAVVARREGSAEGVQALEQTRAAAAQTKEAAKAQQDGAEAQLQETERRMAALRTKMEEERREALRLRQAQQQTEESVRNAKNAYESALSRQKFLQNLKNEYEGYYQSVKNLMRELNDRPGQVPGLQGTLAELIEVPAQYEKALEAVLGGAMQNVVVQTDEDAKAAIGVLRAKKLGRVSFMPLQSLKVRTLSAQEERALDAGMVRADKAVRCAPHIRPAVEFLLARTVIVANMDAAIGLARRSGHSYRIVTAEGDVINAGGTITGGSSQQKNFGLLGREREIEQCAKDAAANEKKAAKLLEESKALAAQFADKQQAYEGCSKQLNGLEVARAEQKLQAETAAKQYAAAADQEQQVQNRMHNAAEAARQSEDVQQRLRAQLEEVQQNLTKTRTQLQAQQQAQAEAGEDLQGQLTELQLQQAALQGEIRHATEQREQTLAAKQLSEQLAAARMLQAAAQQQALLELGAEQQGYDGLLQQYRSEAEGLRAEIETQEAQRLMTSEQLTTLQKQSSEFQSRQLELSEAKYKLENQLDRLTSSIEVSENKLWEDYGMTFGEAERLRTPIRYAESSRELQEIRAQIRELGPINPGAIEEYERVSTRAAEMTTQKADLEQAKADLEELISGILSSMRVVFSEKFEQINQNFGEIFKELFGGGSATVSLAEGDIMECGIEISAEPPGKKLQNISLLSGGERALTGIALLFAMIRINPAPLCLLDEIDAPLDEANVVRFGEYIRKIPDSQFLVITHRKPTMAICQVLFGVTMEEKGVSKLVSVKIQEQE